MQSYKVFFELPCYDYVVVEAKDEDEALDKARKVIFADDYLLDMQIDWDADLEHSFTMEMPNATAE